MTKIKFTTILLLFLTAACSPENAIEKNGVIQLSNAFVADYRLVDHTGAPADDERFEGSPTLIYFGFASCPDVCPAALSVMSATLDELGSKANKIQALFITIDPERDTRDSLKAHLAFDPRILGLTGSVEDITQLTKSMKLYTKKVAVPDSAIEYTMDHQSMFFYVNAAGDVQYAFADYMAPSDIAKAIKALMKQETTN